MPLTWPLPRKGTKYVAVASHNKREGIPLVVLLRDVLRLAENRREVKKILNEKIVEINKKRVRDIRYPVCLFDVVSFPEIKKNYRLMFSEKKKIILKEISEKESETKIFKVMNKKLLKKNIVQINLMHGKNINSKENIKVGDSVMLNLKNNDIIKILPLEKKREVFVMSGKHLGISGKVEDIFERGNKIIAKINYKNKKINVWIKNLIVVD